MSNRHITPLIHAYIHHQLTPAARRRVSEHLQTCATCRAALDGDAQLARDLGAYLPLMGPPGRKQLAALWPTIWQQAQRRPSRWVRLTRLSSYGMVAAALLMTCVFLGSALFDSPTRAVASPMSPADVKPTHTPIFTGEPTLVAVRPLASLTAEVVGIDFPPPVSPVPRAMVRRGQGEQASR
jgi:anti-sigma factor RsiW